MTASGHACQRAGVSMGCNQSFVGLSTKVRSGQIATIAGYQSASGRGASGMRNRPLIFPRLPRLIEQVVDERSAQVLRWISPPVEGPPIWRISNGLKSGGPEEAPKCPSLGSVRSIHAVHTSRTVARWCSSQNLEHQGKCSVNLGTTRGRHTNVSPANSCTTKSSLPET